MEAYEIINYLPEKPRKGMVEWTVENFFEELGGDFLLFRRESIMLEDSLEPSNIEWHWGASCMCTACMEEFVTGWHSNKYTKQNGIKIYQGDDGVNYDGFIPQDKEDFDIATYTEGDWLKCPVCEAEIELIKPATIGNGRTYQIMVVSIENIEGFLTVMTWGVRRYLSNTGYSKIIVKPFEALVYDGKRFHSFSHVKFGLFSESPLRSWERRSYIGQDFTCRRYYDYESDCHRKTGAVLWSEGIPDLTNTTGEKTGLEHYLKNSSSDPKVFAYLKFWKKHPNIENIIYSKWHLVVDSIIDESCNINYYASPTYKIIDSNVIDYSEKKPHKMLGISKEEIRQNYDFGVDELRLYKLLQFYEDNLSVEQFYDYLCFFNYQPLKSIIEVKELYPMIKISKVSTYFSKQIRRIEKQREIYDEDIDDLANLFVDYLYMLKRINKKAEYTEEEIYPKNLAVAHDRLAEAIENQKNNKLRKQFKNIAQKYKKYSYSDGDLCIFVCPNEAELKREGQTLRHCVGGYGNRHCEESDVIFFVRRYRRPERCYYTLDISFSGDEPYRVQLHGYGNEFHGNHKQYRHSIPQKVLDFCDKWEKEILMPIWKAEKIKDKKRSKKNGKSDSSAA